MPRLTIWPFDASFALRNGRNAVMSELNPEYAQMARERLAAEGFTE